jgi:hypothetical protein
VRTAVTIACGAIFFVIGLIFLVAPNNIFMWFVASLSNYFLIAHVIYVGIAFLIVRSYLLCVHEGSHLDDVTEIKMTEEGYKEASLGITFGFAAFLAFSTIPGYKISWDLALGCYDWSAPCRYMGTRTAGFFSSLIYGLSALVALLYFAALPFIMAGVGAVVGMTLPTFAAGVISFSQRHPAEGFMARSLEQFRSDPRAERELLRIMVEQDASDQEVERLMGRLAPWERWYKRIEYRKRARDVKRLREMAELKRRALEEETRFAESVHGLEGARRRADDRR